MRILATLPLHLYDVQTEIIKGFIYFLCRLAKVHKVTFVLCQKKKMKEYRETKLAEKLTNAGAEIIYVEDILKEHLVNRKNWVANNNRVEKLIGGSYDAVFIYAYPISAEKQMRKMCEDFYWRKEVKITFNSLIGKYKQTYPFYYIARKFQIPTMQFVVDWMEPNLERIYEAEQSQKNKTIKSTSMVKQFGVYSQAERGVKFLPIYDMYIFRKGKQEYEKDLDFVFGYTITYVNRRYLHESLRKGIKENADFVLYARDRYWDADKELDGGNKARGRNDAVPQDEYFREIERARFSYVVPANDKNEFSIQRFYECISRDCIPLVDSRCVLKHAFSDKQDVVEFYKRNGLIVDLKEQTINAVVAELNYSKLLKELNKLESIQKLFNLERYENFINKSEEYFKKVFTS